jgi:PEP-CTERM motif
LSTGEERIVKRNAKRNGQRWLILATATVAALPPLHAAATTRQWKGGTSNWNTASNWNPSGVPGSGDIANVTGMTTTSQTITYNYTGSAVSLSGLTVDLTGGAGGASEILSMSANSLSVDGFEYVGYNGLGTINQSGGTNTISNAGYSLILGLDSGSTDAYTLSGSGSLSVAGNEQVGGAGSGSFEQNSGQNSAGNVVVGDGSTGTYVLSGTGSLSAGAIFAGGVGTGIFNQSGGTNTIGSNGLYVTFDENNSTGTYNLSSGSLSVNSNENVGYYGSGTFNQSGGTNTLGSSGNLYLGYNSGSTGVYTLSGSGSLLVTGATGEYLGENSSGTFNQSGGTNQSGGLLELGANMGSSGTYNLSGGALSINGDEIVGNYGSGTFNQSGGTNTIGNYLYIGIYTDSSFLLSGGSATVASNVYVGGSPSAAGGAGVLNVTNTGVLNVGGTLTVFNTPGSVVNLEGGTISTSVLNFEQLPSLFNWTSGLLELTNPSGVIFDSSPAALESSLSLNSGMGLYVGGAEYVGFSGTGIINQTGGNNGVSYSSSLLLGYGTGTGTYVLTGTGLLSAGEEEVGGSGAGTFNQSGGTNYSNYGLSIATSPGSTGVYALSGGTLITYYSAYVGGSASGPGGAGVMTVSGSGAFSVAQGITVYNTPGSALNINGGLVSASSLNLLGVYSQTGGAATFGQITGTGQMAISGGTTMLSAGGGTSQVSGLSISGNGVLDLTNNSFIVDYGIGNQSPVAAVASNLQSGYNGGAWNGVGIVSSAVATLNGSQRALTYSIGYADGSDGITGVPSGEIEIMPTLAGDAKLQGNVVFGDFQLLAQYFGQANTSWDEGDFTYNGTTNFGDFQLLAQDFGADSTGLTAGEVASLNSFAAQFNEEIVPNANGAGISLVSVPEPGTAGLLALAGLGVLGRWRRKPH